MREEISGGDVVIVVVVVAGRDNVKEVGVVFRERKASSTPKFGQLNTTCRLPQATTQTRDDFQRRSLVPAPLFPDAKAPNNLRTIYPFHLSSHESMPAHAGPPAAKVKEKLYSS